MVEAGVDSVKEQAVPLTVFVPNVGIKLPMLEEHLAFPLCAQNVGQR